MDPGPSPFWAMGLVPSQNISKKHKLPKQIANIKNISKKEKPVKQGKNTEIQRTFGEAYRGSMGKQLDDQTMQVNFARGGRGYDDKRLPCL